MKTEEIQKTIIKFKDHLEVVDGIFLSNHLIGYISHGIIYPRGDRDSWMYKDYIPSLDKDAISTIGMDEKNNFFYVTGTKMYDEYITHLLHSYCLEHRDESYDECIDNKILKEIIPLWKELVIKDYNQIEHIKRFVWNLIIQASDSGKEQYINGHCHISIFANENNLEKKETIEKISNTILSKDTPIDFSVFQSRGLLCKITNYNRREVKVLKILGICGEYISKRNVIMPNQHRITVPKTIYHPDYGYFYINDISENLKRKYSIQIQ